MVEAEVLILPLKFTAGMLDVFLGNSRLHISTRSSSIQLRFLLFLEVFRLVLFLGLSSRTLPGSESESMLVSPKKSTASGFLKASNFLLNMGVTLCSSKKDNTFYRSETSSTAIIFPLTDRRPPSSSKLSLPRVGEMPDWQQDLCEGDPLGPNSRKAVVYSFSLSSLVVFLVVSEPSSNSMTSSSKDPGPGRVLPAWRTTSRDNT